MKYIILCVLCIAAVAASWNRSGTIKSITVSPIQHMDPASCVGSGTYRDATQWSCAKVQWVKITLTDGTVLGPYAMFPSNAVVR